MNIFFRSLFSIPLALGGSLAVAQTNEVPRHLVLARDLVEHIKPEDNRYALGGQWISFPGDTGSGKYSLRADCSGFLLALFDRAKYSTESRMTFLPSPRVRRRLASEDFVYSIEREKGFKRIDKVVDIRPGDVLAHAMLRAEDKEETGTTGHVRLADGHPKPISARKPIVEGTTQFELTVIDSNEEYVGEDDSRLKDPSNKIKGLGTGTIRIYADASGELVGWAKTFKNTNRFFSYSPRFPSDTKLRKAAIGRPITEN